MVRLVHLVKSMVDSMVAPLFSRQVDPRRGHPGEMSAVAALTGLPQGDFTEAVLEATARRLL